MLFGHDLAELWQLEILFNVELDEKCLSGIPVFRALGPYGLDIWPVVAEFHGSMDEVEGSMEARKQAGPAAAPWRREEGEI